LVLAGLQAYRDTRDIGLAKHRMAGRRNDLLLYDDSGQERELKP